MRRVLLALRSRAYRVRYRKVQFGTSFVAARLVVTGGGRVSIGDGTYIDGAVGPTRIEVAKGATVRIGNDCYLNGLSIIAVADVDIGSGCLFGDALVLTTNFHSTGVDRRVPGVGPKIAPVRIEDNVWVAGRVIVLPGVTVARDSVLSIGSVISRDVPPATIVSSHQQHVLRGLGPSESAL